VELLTDGASAIYGADAVAGVVNFVLRKDFEGAETTLSYGETSDGGAEETAISQLFGTAWDTGNAMAVYEYRSADPLRAEQRSYIPVDPLNGIGGSFLIIPEQTRHSALLSFRQSISDRLTSFVDATYTERKYEQDQEIFGALTNSSGEASQYGAAAGLEYALSSSWRAQLVGNYSRMRERSQTVSTFLPGLTDHGGRTSTLTSLDLTADGPLVSIPAGDIRASMGVGFRDEQFDTDATLFTPRMAGFGRDSYSLYGELLVPIVSDSSSRFALKRLELTVSGRLEKYEEFDSSTNPKFGVFWMPTSSIGIRGSYGTSFRAPTVYQQLNDARAYFIEPIPDPDAPDLSTNTLVLFGGGNSSLTPERAHSYTIGFDVKPKEVPGFALSATYFNIRFEDRISTLPLIGPFSTIFTDPNNSAALAPFVDRTPDSAEIDRAFNVGPLQNEANIAASDVEAVLDFRQHNIAVTKTSGVELSVAHQLSTRFGEITSFISGDKLFKLSFQPTSTTPAGDTVGTVFNPVELRLRAGISWSRGPFVSALSLNHSSDYQNNIETPPGRIGSWTTADIHLSYTTGGGSRVGLGALRDLSLALNIQNVANRQPPVVSNPSLIIFPDLRFDPTNASPLGRFITLQIGKRW
jgi:outer membrane receptor protein involved in Fe transport